MINITNIYVYGFEAAIRGMRNPMNSWDKMDSHICEEKKHCQVCEYYITEQCTRRCAIGDAFIIGENDMSLAKRLANSGTDHAKFLRMIDVTCDVTAPLYWWKEFDTYKVGTVANSCSTMHKIHSKEFTLDDFSHEHLLDDEKEDILTQILGSKNQILLTPLSLLKINVAMLNFYREKYLETKDKVWWWQMIQTLPDSYNQRRTCHLNYAVLKNIYHARKNHKLDCWHTFCEFIESLPYAKELIVGE